MRSTCLITSIHQVYLFQIGLAILIVFTTLNSSGEDNRNNTHLPIASICLLTPSSGLPIILTDLPIPHPATLLSRPIFPSPHPTKLFTYPSSYLLMFSLKSYKHVLTSQILIFSSYIPIYIEISIKCYKYLFIYLRLGLTPSLQILNR